MCIFKHNNCNITEAISVMRIVQFRHFLQSPQDRGRTVRNTYRINMTPIEIATESKTERALLHFHIFIANVTLSLYEICVLPCQGLESTGQI